MKSEHARHPDDMNDEEAKAWLSALADGEASALDAACEHWRHDEQARRTWHAYHLIGDVMRSDELASTPQRDAAFMAGLRERLAQEPVVLAPVAPPAAAKVESSSWSIPAAVVAGFVVVAGVLVVARMGPAGAPGASLELAAASGAQGRSVELRQVANGQALITDPRLDEFLRVHQSAGGSMAAPTPGGTLRRVEVIVPGAPGAR